MAYATTINWNREPHNNIIGVMNTLAEDLQWYKSLFLNIDYSNL